MPKMQSTRRVDPTQSLIAPLLKEPVERYCLENGLTVILKPDDAAGVCSAQVWVKTGSIHEGAHLGAGLSHFVEHMLFKGTEKREGRAISEAVQAAGGYINAYTTFDRTVYYIDIPSDSVDVALDVLGDSVFHSTLPAGEVEKEREVILREIDMGEDDPDNRLFRGLFETTFRSHPYRYPIIGYKDVFSQVSREDLVSYYESRYVPNNAVLVVTGDFEAESLKARIETHFGDTPRRAIESVYVPEEPLQLAARELAMSDDVHISRVGLGFQSPGLTHEDTPALDALAMILGSGNSSLLHLRLREDLKLVHSVDATNWTPGTVGVFYIALMCDSDKRESAVDEARRYLDGLAESDFSEALVAKAIRQILVNEVNSRKTVSGQAARLGAAEVVVGDIGYAGNYLESVARITPADVYRVLEKWLRWDRLTSIYLDPKSDENAGKSESVGESSTRVFDERPQPNGSSLLLRENKRLPNLHFRVVLQGGALFEPEGKQGLTALMATLLTKGTRRRSATEVASAIESVGGSFYEFSGNNSLGLAVEVLPSDCELALDILEESLLRPAFDEAAFALEKESQIAGIKEGMDDIVSVGRDALRLKFFGAHPFRIGASGSLETVGSLTLEDVRSHWTELCVAGNVSLAVSGDFDRSELEPKLHALLGKLPRGNVERVAQRIDAPAEIGAHRERMERQQAIVFHAYPGPGIRSGRDYYTAEVADELFSGMSSNLFERVREELSLAYFVRSSRIIGLDAAVFYFYAGTSPERYGEVISELEKEVDRVSNGAVSEEEIERCRIRLKAARRMGMQTNSSCAAHAAMNTAYGLSPNDEEEYGKRIDGIGVSDLQAFAKNYLDPQKRVELVIGPV